MILFAANTIGYMFAAVHRAGLVSVDTSPSNETL